MIRTLTLATALGCFALAACGSNPTSNPDASIPTDGASGLDGADVAPADGNRAFDSVSPDGIAVDATTCGDGATTCNGQCVSIDTDPTNCGGCGLACGAGDSCCAGSCANDCSALTLSGITPATGPLSGGTWLTMTGSGFGPGTRVWLGDGRAPALVVDSHTLRVKTPPGSFGAVDVRVESSAGDAGPTAHAVRLQAYHYARYPVAGEWARVDLSSPRGNWPGVSVLQDGNVLISGGVANSTAGSALDTADVYDWVAHTTAPTAGPMSAPRWTQASVTLLTGDVLVLGTFPGGFTPPTGPVADRYDPTLRTFTPTGGPPSVEHLWPHAVLLADDRVLVVSYTFAGIELYDPAIDAFSVVPNTPNVAGYRPTRLRDGTVLLVKGGGAPVQRFDPDTLAVETLGAGPNAQDGDLFTLPDGRVLYVGGSVGTASTDVIEVFDPAQGGDFHPAGYHLMQARQRWLTTTLAGDGSVFVIGGDVSPSQPTGNCANNEFMPVAAVERIDPVAGTVTAFSPLPEPNFIMSATTTLDGSIVAAGGAPCGGGNAYPYFYFLQGVPPG